MSERPNSGNNHDKTQNRRNKIVDDSFLFSLPYELFSFIIPSNYHLLWYIDYRAVFVFP